MIELIGFYILVVAGLTLLGGYLDGKYLDGPWDMFFPSRYSKADGELFTILAIAWPIWVGYIILAVTVSIILIPFNFLFNLGKSFRTKK